MRKTSTKLRIGALVATFCATASANGRFPAASMLVSQPNDPSHLALRSTYGLLVSKDTGATWDWVCERAMGYSGNEDPSVLMAGSGAIVLGTFEGMARSTDGGCQWTRDPSWPAAVVDLASRPNAPDRLYAATCAFSQEGDAGNLYKSQLFVSDDAGAHWAARSTFDPSLLIDTVEVAPSDAKRVYISAVRVRGGKSQGVVLRSDDDGAHWKEQAIAITAADRGLYIAGVDPKAAGTIYVRTDGIDAGRLLLSKDGAASMKEIAHGGPLQGFALADEGGAIYVGGPKDGLLRAAAADEQFSKVSAGAVQCLTSVGTTLWACAPTGVGYVLGASTDRGATFSPKLTLAGMRGPLQCASPSAMDRCGDDWSALRALIGPDPKPDAGVSAATNASSAPAKRGTFACGIAPDRSPPTWALGLSGAVLSALLVRRRRTKRRARDLRVSET